MGAKYHTLHCLYLLIRFVRGGPRACRSWRAYRELQEFTLVLYQILPIFQYKSTINPAIITKSQFWT